MEFSSVLSAICRKSCAQSFPPIFGLFEIFDHNFAKLVASPSNNNQNYLVPLKRQSMLKKGIKASSKSIHKPRHNTCSKYVTVEGTALRLLSVTEKKQTYKHHVFAPTVGARRTIFPKLCTVIELVEAIKKEVSIFRSNV